MTEKEARRLQVGDGVAWVGIGKQTICGTVTARSPFGFYAEWDDGDSGWIDYRDAIQVQYHD